MDLRKKVYRMFILGTEGGGFKEALAQGLGGVIFFTHDIRSVEQFKALIRKIKAASPLDMPFLSIDQEGGRVERTENIHKGKKYLSARFAYSKGEEFLKEQTQNIAEELKNFGINLNFAPCIDVNTNPENPIIGERAFSDNADDVIKGGLTVSKIYREYGIMPCAKHFPGHGDANSDSHLTLPEINLTLSEMKNVHLKPFKALADIEMIMVAHLHCTCFEEDKIPCSLSKNAIDYLRTELKFKGIAISDDMEMQGVKGFGDVEACIKGIKAGLNMFIYRNSKPETIDIIEKVVKIAENDKELQRRIDESYEIICNQSDNIYRRFML